MVHYETLLRYFVEVFERQSKTLSLPESDNRPWETNANFESDDALEFLRYHWKQYYERIVSRTLGRDEGRTDRGPKMEVANGNLSEKQTELQPKVHVWDTHNK